MHAWRIGIVGGGPGGLFTAFLLEQLATTPCRVTVFEASPRVGGKIRTDHFHAAPIRYEAGAAEFYDYSPVDSDPLRELIAELGLSIRPMEGSAALVDGKLVANRDDWRRAYGAEGEAALATFDRVARDQLSPAEFYVGDQPGSELSGLGTRFSDYLARRIAGPARCHIERFIHSDLATEPERTSVAYGLQNYLMNHTAYMRLYSIEGGNEQLPQAIAKRLSAEIRLENPVVRLEASSTGGVLIESRTGTDVRRDEFDRVVVALPHNRLLDVNYGDASLDAAMRRHHAHFHYPAHYLRMTLLFERPFWRRHMVESFVMLGQFDGCCLYDESSRHPDARHGVLGWLLGGAAAETWSQRSDDELIEAALSTLPAAWGPAREFLLEGRVHRWVDAVNGSPGGEPLWSLDRRHHPAPSTHPGLFVVGDYLFDSTLNGVLDSADYVAHRLAAELADQASNSRLRGSRVL